MEDTRRCRVEVIGDTVRLTGPMPTAIAFTVAGHQVAVSVAEAIEAMLEAERSAGRQDGKGYAVIHDGTTASSTTIEGYEQALADKRVDTSLPFRHAQLVGGSGVVVSKQWDPDAFPRGGWRDASWQDNGRKR